MPQPTSSSESERGSPTRRQSSTILFAFSSVKNAWSRPLNAIELSIAPS